MTAAIWFNNDYEKSGTVTGKSLIRIEMKKRREKRKVQQADDTWRKEKMLS
jgi:hypothetical protein